MACFALGALGFAGCGEERAGGGSDATSGTTSGAGGSAALPALCTAGSRWSANTPAFREATSDWGLDAIGAEGVRLAAVDYDGDGWPDLAVRRGGTGADDFAEGGIRQTWLLRNTGAGRFEDVTAASGIRQNRTEPSPDLGRPGEVFAFADVDNDGDLDVYTGLSRNADAPSVETSELLLNAGDGTFELGPEASALRVSPGQDVPAGASFVDLDRNGVVDLWVPQNSIGSPRQDKLYYGDGTGFFGDITESAGLKTKAWLSSTTTEELNAGLAHSNAWSAAACDLNGDGNPELLASSYGRAPSHLWQGGGPGVPFVNRSVDSGYAYDERVDWTDNESARCWCQLHPTDEDCAGVPPPDFIPCSVDADAFRWSHATDREPYRLGGNSGATACADIDNDGDLDLLTGEIVHWDVGSSSDPAEICLNTGEADVRFTRPGNEATGLVRKHSGGWNEGIMSHSVFDFDNDGWLDVYLGNSDYPGNVGLLYHQDAPAHFEAVPTADGIDHRRSHGSAVADFDRDGDLDLVVGHSFARCEGECYATQQVRFFENVLGHTGNWVALSLSGGPGTNRAAIGARVTAISSGIVQTREVGGGYGHYGAQDDLTVYFGLGTGCEAEVTVRWPDAALSTQTFTLPAGYRFTLVQGGEPVAVLPAE